MRDTEKDPFALSQEDTPEAPMYDQEAYGSDVDPIAEGQQEATKHIASLLQEMPESDADVEGYTAA